MPPVKCDINIILFWVRADGANGQRLFQSQVAALGQNKSSSPSLLGPNSVFILKQCVRAFDPLQLWLDHSVPRGPWVKHILDNSASSKQPWGHSCPVPTDLLTDFSLLAARPPAAQPVSWGTRTLLSWRMALPPPQPWRCHRHSPSCTDGRAVPQRASSYCTCHTLVLRELSVDSDHDDGERLLMNNSAALSVCHGSCFLIDFILPGASPSGLSSVPPPEQCGCSPLHRVSQA